MKAIKSLMKAVLLMLSVGVFAQNTSSQMQSQSENDLIQSVFNAEKRSLVDEYMNLKGEDEEVFWEIYNKYEADMSELSKERLDLMQNYAQDFDNLTEDQADKFSKEYYKLDKKTQAVSQKYYNQMKKRLSPKQALSFKQLDDYIRTAVRFHVLDAIPFVENK